MATTSVAVPDTPLIRLALARADDALVVLAAASLKAPLQAGATAFEKLHPGIHVMVSAAGTGVLLRQLEAGVPCELVYPGAPDAKHATTTEFLIDALKGFPKPLMPPTASNAR